MEFVVGTDQPDCRNIDLSLTANLLPAWEVKRLGGESVEASSSAETSQTFQAITRSLGLKGCVPPIGVETSGPFQARFVGDPVPVTGAGGVLEVRRTVEVDLTTSEVGAYSGELVFTWQDGARQTQPLSRQVWPHLRLTPSTLVVGTKDGLRKYKVILQSDSQPFHILEVRGAALSGPLGSKTEPALVHVIDLEVDPSRLD